MLSYLCLIAHSDIQPVLCSVFVLFGKVSCMHRVSAFSGLYTLVLSTRWKLSQQIVVCTTFDIYVFVYLFLACKEFIDRMKLIEYSPLQSKENYFQRLDAKLIVNDTFDVTFTCINDNKLIGMSKAICVWLRIVIFNPYCVLFLFCLVKCPVCTVFPLSLDCPLPIRCSLAFT
jgi:hypothetical protein